MAHFRERKGSSRQTICLLLLLCHPWSYTGHSHLTLGSDSHRSALLQPEQIYGYVDGFWISAPGETASFGETCMLQKMRSRTEATFEYFFTLPRPWSFLCLKIVNVNSSVFFALSTDRFIVLDTIEVLLDVLIYPVYVCPWQSCLSSRQRVRSLFVWHFRNTTIPEQICTRELM